MTQTAELLAQFHKVAHHPKAQLQAFLDRGKKVVGCVPVYTPEEIIHAMGMVPFGVWGAEIQVREAKQYFPAFICSIMQTILEEGMAGTYDGVSAMVIPSLCDSLKCLGQNWKYAVPHIPFIPMTYPQNRNNQYGKAFTTAGYERVIADLETETKMAFSETALARSNQIYNQHNRVMRRLSDILSDYPSVTAAQRNDIFKSAYFMTKEEHTALVSELTAQLLKTPKEIGRKKRIIISGILADSPGLLAVIDENNLQVVADDMAHESRQYRTDVDESQEPLAGLTDKFARMDHCSVLYDPEKKRGDYIVELATKTSADGIIMLLTKFCDPEEFDYPILKKKFDRAGIPSLLVEVDRQMGNYGQTRTAIETFQEMLT